MAGRVLNNFIDIDVLQDWRALAQILEQEDAPAKISSSTLEGITPSCWSWICYSAEESQERERIHLAVETLFKSRVCEQYQGDKPSQDLIQKHWQTIFTQACVNIGQSSSDPGMFLEVSKVRDIFNELNQIIVDVEPNGFFPFGTSEPVEGQHIRNILKFAFHDIPLDSRVINGDTINALLVDSTPEQRDEFRNELQFVMISLFDTLKKNYLEHSPVLEMFLGYSLCLFGQYYRTDGLDPNVTQTVKVPKKINDSWELIDYKIEVIPLTPTWMPEVIEAVALTPISRQDAPRLLLYKGTRGPVSLLADVVPGAGAGEVIWWAGRDKVNNWIRQVPKVEAQAKVDINSKVEIHAYSQGGGVAYLTASENPDQVKIHVYAPAGVFPRNQADLAGEQIEGNIYVDPNDWVSMVGYHPEGPNFVKVIRDNPPNFYISHVRTYGGEKTILLRVATVWENQSVWRIISNVVHQIFSVPIALVLITVITAQIIYAQISALFYQCFCANTDEQASTEIPFDTAHLSEILEHA